jgi:hypothetical protein
MKLMRRVVSQGGFDPDAFVMTVDTTQAGSASDTFILRCGNTGTYNATIDWGDDSTSEITTYNDADLTHVYASGGVYTVIVTGTLPYVHYNNFGDKAKVMTIEQWGSVGFESMFDSFQGCSNLRLNATDTVLLPAICQNMFRDCTSLNDSLASLDMTNVTHLTGFIFGATSFNQPIDFINSGSVQWWNDFANGCTALNQAITYDTSGGISFDNMFNACPNLKQSLGGLDFSSVVWTAIMTGFCDDSDLDASGTANYDATLNAWAAQLPIPAQNPDMGTSQYSAAGKVGRDLLVAAGWTITDGGLV